MALPVTVPSFTRSNGVLDDWSIENIVADTLQRNSTEDGVGAAFLSFKMLPSIVNHYSNTPVLPGPDLVIKGWV